MVSPHSKIVIQGADHARAQAAAYTPMQLIIDSTKVETRRQLLMADLDSIRTGAQQHPQTACPVGLFTHAPAPGRRGRAGERLQIRGSAHPAPVGAGNGDMCCTKRKLLWSVSPIAPCASVDSTIGWPVEVSRSSILRPS